MKIIKFVLYFISLIFISFTIISFVVKKSIGEGQISIILDYTQKEYKIPDNLEQFKDTPEYQKLEEEVNKINNFLNQPTTKAVIKYLNFLSNPNSIKYLIIITSITLLIELLVIRNIFQVIIANSFNALITSIFLLAVPRIFSKYANNQIVVDLFTEFNKYGGYILAISLIILIVSNFLKEKISN